MRDEADQDAAFVALTPDMDANQFEMHCFELNKIMTKYSNSPAMKLPLNKLFNVIKIQLFNLYFQN
jgi:hypothetical protein